jgi:NAD(P)-dependent dehydrogenase (short-subunit alcohol dehydrogenase family)
MAAAGYGRIVLTSSIGGLYGTHRVGNYGAAKAGIIGLANVAAIEGADVGVRCNVIVPAALTRLAEGLDTSFYPPMAPELVAPAVGWLAHESCSITGEALVAIAGRVARAYVAETNGVYQPSWTIEDVAARIGEIRDQAGSWALDVVPSGQADHIMRSFAMAKAAKGSADEG